MTSVPAAPGAHRAVFLDRDGTIIQERHFLAHPDGVELMPNAASALARLHRAGRLIVLVTNQSGIARGLISEAQYAATAARVREVVQKAGGHIDAMYHCPHYPEISGPCECRKPGTLLYRRAATEHDIDLTRSAYVGDRLRDVLPAKVLGGQGILVAGAATPPAERELAEGTFAVVATLEAAVPLLLDG